VALNTDRVTSSSAKPIRFGLWANLMWFQSYFHGLGFPTPLTRDQFSVGAKNQTLFVWASSPARTTIVWRFSKAILNQDKNCLVLVPSFAWTIPWA